jgi:protein MYSM1
MFRDQIPLPDKVKESGEGYTLSGKPLDPNSAAAKPYLNRGGNTVPDVKKPLETADDPMEGVETNKEADPAGSAAVEAAAPEATASNTGVETQTEALRISDKNGIKKESKSKKTKSANPSPSSSSK